MAAMLEAAEEFYSKLLETKRSETFNSVDTRESDGTRAGMTYHHAGRWVRKEGSLPTSTPRLRESARARTWNMISYRPFSFLSPFLFLFSSSLLPYLKIVYTISNTPFKETPSIEE